MQDQRSDSVRQISNPPEKRRGRTTTLRLLDYLNSFSANVDPTVRATDEDPHLSFVRALQNNFEDRTRVLQERSKPAGPVSVPSLLHKISSDSSPTLTAKDLAHLIAGGSGEPQPDFHASEIAHRQHVLRESIALREQAIVLSCQGRELFLSGDGENAQSHFQKADDLFRQAVLLIRDVEDGEQS